MDRIELLKQINTVFRDTLDNEDLVIVETTTANDVGEWDSLTHIQLVVALEKQFYRDISLLLTLLCYLCPDSSI